MLTILLAEAELEIIPDEIAQHPSVFTHAKRRGKKTSLLLLDSSLHHSAMKRLSENTRRGRPDIIHISLLVALESILNKDGQLRVLVHTRGDLLLKFDPAIRLSKNYNRFVGLMEQLFETGCVPKESRSEGKEPLIELVAGQTLPGIVNGLREDAKARGAVLKVVVLSEGARGASSPDYFHRAGQSGEDHLVIIGGFPEGDFASNMDELKADDSISIHQEPLTAWTVASEVLVGYRAGYLAGSDKAVKDGGGN